MFYIYSFRLSLSIKLMRNNITFLCIVLTFLAKKLLEMNRAISIKGDEWLFNDYKIVKIVKSKSPRIAFQRHGYKYTRGLSITKEAFLKMEDVTIVPSMRIELEPNVFLTNYGTSIHLVKYCLTKDGKRCDGGFFTFTPKEWIFYWTNIRQCILTYLSR